MVLEAKKNNKYRLPCISRQFNEWTRKHSVSTQAGLQWTSSVNPLASRIFFIPRTSSRHMSPRVGTDPAACMLPFSSVNSFYKHCYTKINLTVYTYSAYCTETISIVKYLNLILNLFSLKVNFKC